MEAADASPPLEVSPRAGSSSWRRSKTWSRSSSIARSGSSSCGSGSIEYTSLRDVLEEEESSAAAAAAGGWAWGEYSSHDIHEFDASNIGIRNQLLKHAASAYLQSAVVVAPGGGRGGDGDYCCWCCLWRRAAAGRRAGGGRGARGRVLVRACASCWQGWWCVDDPAAFVARSARRIAAFVGAVWPRRAGGTRRRGWSRWRMTIIATPIWQQAVTGV